MAIYTNNPAKTTKGANTAHSTQGMDNIPAPDPVCSAGAFEAVAEASGTTVLSKTVDGVGAAGTRGVSEAGARDVVGPVATEV